jgi:hypothetical protein
MTTNAILNPSELSPMVRNNDERCWQAVVARDASYDDRFVFAVSSTGVYCRPSCAASNSSSLRSKPSMPDTVPACAVALWLRGVTRRSEW